MKAELKADLLEQEFKVRSIENADGPPRLRPEDAIELVNRAADEGVPIRGIDGFEPGRDRAGSREHFADFSPAVDQGHGCWEDAEAFIRRRSDLGLVFEIGLGDDPLQVV